MQKIHGKTWGQILFIKKEILAQMFSCGFCEIPSFQNTAGQPLLFLYPLKISENQSDVFRGYRKRPVVLNGSKGTLVINELNMLLSV